jgi:DhnA family fructose-bisphosphate aldolase class Ia
MTYAQFAREVRMARLFCRPSGRAAIVAWAHGPLLGPIPGTTAPDIARLGPALAQADGLLVTPAMLTGLRDVLARRDRPSLFALATWQSISRPRDLLGYDEGSIAPLTSVGDAARMGADGVMTYLYVGFEDARQEADGIEYVGEVSRECRDLGLLHMVESRAVRDEFGPDGLARPELVAYHVRLAAELGADIVKTKWTGPDSFPGIARDCPVPVLIAGGPRRETLDEALTEARAVLASGARGLVWGRNVYQQDDPAAALERLGALLDDEREAHP